MPISERMRHGLSTLLVVTLAATTVGWTAAGRDRDHCTRQQHPCAPVAALTCQCHVLPDSPDTARLPQIAPPSPGTCTHLSLMDPMPARDDAVRAIDVTSRRVRPPLDLLVLHRTLLI